MNVPRNDLPEFLDRRPAQQNAVLEGGDPPPGEDDILTVPAEVSQEEAIAVITDMIGSGSTGRVHAKRVLERFARKGWRIVKEG